MMAISVSSLIPLILALVSVISNEDPSCGSFWLYGYTPIKPNLLTELIPKRDCNSIFYFENPTSYKGRKNEKNL